MFREKIREFTQTLSGARLGLYATSGAYYLFLSLWPLAILFLSLLPYTSLSQEQLLNMLLGYAPGPFRQLMTLIAADIYDSSAAAIGFGLATELWSGGKFLSALIGGIGHIYDGDSRRESSFRRRLLGATYAGLLALLIIGELGLLFFGQRLLGAAALRHPGFSRLFGLLSYLRCPLFLIGVSGMLLLLFIRLPKRKLPLRRLLPGAVSGATAWLFFSQLYSWAVERFHLFSVYGSLAFVIVSLFWMYCSLYILFFAAWLNTYLTLSRPNAEKAQNE
ncbi:MAG: YihY/virulence factor BrkB family protein [Oscillospiraceae bacterium]|nr:YihY/virulence factor BrkB family protein [Oscillospiraceae bacterium]